MANKVQRWFDLLAALLRRNYPVSFEDLIREVPAYQDSGQSADTRRRMFERDKDELRTFGVPIETADIGDEQLGYRLDRKNFYLPYLEVLRDGHVAHRPTPVDKFGYRSLPTLAFEPDELRAIQDVAPRLKTLGIAGILDDARSALRKLGADLPLNVPDAGPEHPGAHDASPAVAAAFDPLAASLDARKRVTFTYRSLNSGTHSSRTVEPYGLFFLGHTWYLAAPETGQTVVKNFRLSRMADVSVNAQKPGTPDYQIPTDFDLREHARSRQAWELGSADVIEATVEVINHNGAARAITRLGEPVAGHPNRRVFRVRRLDPFARWLLGFAGAARPLAPPALIERYRAIAQETLHIYEKEGAA